MPPIQRIWLQQERGSEQTRAGQGKPARQPEVPSSYYLSCGKGLVKWARTSWICVASSRVGVMMMAPTYQKDPLTVPKPASSHHTPTIMRKTPAQVIQHTALSAGKWGGGVGILAKGKHQTEAPSSCKAPQKPITTFPGSGRPNWSQYFASVILFLIFWTTPNCAQKLFLEAGSILQW